MLRLASLFMALGVLMSVSAQADTVCLGRGLPGVIYYQYAATCNSSSKIYLKNVFGSYHGDDEMAVLARDVVGTKLAQDHIYPVVKLFSPNVGLEEVILFSDKTLDKTAQYCVVYRDRANCSANVKLMTDVQQNISLDEILRNNSFAQISRINNVENNWDESLPAVVYVKKN